MMVVYGSVKEMNASGYGVQKGGQEKHNTTGLKIEKRKEVEKIRTLLYTSHTSIHFHTHLVYVHFDRLP